MRHLGYIVILLIAFASCRSAKPTVESVKTVIDSTTTKVTYETKYDTIRIPGDTVRIIVPIADLSSKPIIKKSTTGRSKAAISKVNNNIEVECLCAEEEQIIASQNTIIETLTKRLETSDTTKTVIEYKTPWYSKALSTIGILALLALIIGFGIRRLKPF